MTTSESQDSAGGQPMGVARRDLLRAGAASAGVLASALSHGQGRSGAAVRGYRTLGNTGLRISDISFGASRLSSGEEPLVQAALDRGVNYFDTADSYRRGASEQVLGKALVGRRDEVVIASKQHAGAAKDRGAMMRTLEGSLSRLQTDRIDVYFNHAVNSLDRLTNPEWYEFVDRARQQGKIRFTGMSGHAGRLIECLDHAVEQELIDVMLVGYNFGQDPVFYERATRDFDRIATQPDLPRVLARAREKGIGTIAMKTLMGARLNDLRAYEGGGAHTFAQAAFRWTLANPDVDALVISMTSQARIEEYLGASGMQPAQPVAAEDLRVLRQYAELHGAHWCRPGCDLCAGACPANVAISDVLRTRMYAVDYQDAVLARDEYAALGAGASACLSCSGTPCADACPNGIAINALCGPTHELLS